jgi:hypothetical protein
MADAEDLKSSGDFSSCGFDFQPGHHSIYLVFDQSIRLSETHLFCARHLRSNAARRPRSLQSPAMASWKLRA